MPLPLPIPCRSTLAHTHTHTHTPTPPTHTHACNHLQTRTISMESKTEDTRFMTHHYSTVDIMWLSRKCFQKPVALFSCNMDSDACLVAMWHLHKDNANWAVPKNKEVRCKNHSTSIGVILHIWMHFRNKSMKYIDFWLFIIIDQLMVFCWLHLFTPNFGLRKCYFTESYAWYFFFQTK